MWVLYLTKADAQAFADKATANMHLPLGPNDVTRQWDVPKATGDGKWGVCTPDDPKLLVGATRGEATAKPTWPADPGLK